MFRVPDFNPTSTNRPIHRHSKAGWTIPETLLSIGITGILMLVIVAMMMTSGRAFLALSNYVELDAANKVAMDTLTRDLRQCNRVTAFSTTAVSIEDSDGATITYAFNSGPQTFTRTKNGVSKTLLTQCSTLEMKRFQRNVKSGSFEMEIADTLDETKVVEVSWNCYRTILGARANTESVQTARIVIRKQG